MNTRSGIVFGFFTIVVLATVLFGVVELSKSYQLGHEGRLNIVLPRFRLANSLSRVHFTRPTTDALVVPGTKLLYRVVLSRLDEDVNWTLALHPHVGVTLFNKGELLDDQLQQGLDSRGNAVVQANPNIGFECFGYLKFIIDNYDSLPLYTTFVHARIEPGGWGPPEQTEEMHGVEMLNAAFEWTQESFAAQASVDGIDALEGVPHYVSMNHFSLLRCTDIRTDHCCTLQPALEHQWVFNNFYDSPGNKTPQCVSLDFGASFQVSRSIILSHPREKYWRLWKRMEAKSWESGVSSKDMCIVLETSWHMIFREPPISKNAKFTYFRTYNDEEYSVLQNSISAWRPQSCVVPEHDESLVVDRDCQKNLYIDSAL